MGILDLRQRLNALTAEQALLLDNILEDMDNPDLNAQLKALDGEKQDLLKPIQALEKEEAQRNL